MQTRGLHQLANLEQAQVTEVERVELSSKLIDMGLYPGKQVKVMFRAPFHGPIAVDVDGYLLSLRMDEAALVKVK
jgi:ferrous iron transport protein A